MFDWPETGGNQDAILPCEYGAPFGIGSANAYRNCMSGGTWSQPDFSACRDSKNVQIH